MCTPGKLKTYIDFLVEKARIDDQHAQKELYKNCENASLSIALQYLRKGREIGLTFDDLTYLVSTAFLKALTTYNDEYGNFLDYFKYIYLMDAKSEFRRKFRENQKVVTMPEETFSTTLEFHSESHVYDHKPFLLDQELVIKAIFNNEIPTLTKKEHLVLTRFLKSESVKQIARDLNKNYTETYRVLKRAIEKVRNHFIND